MVHADDALVHADSLAREVRVHPPIFAAPVEPFRAEHRASTAALRGQDDRGVSLVDGALALGVALKIIAAYGARSVAVTPEAVQQAAVWSRGPLRRDWASGAR